MYESLRGLLADTELKDASQILSALDLTFTIDDEVSTAVFLFGTFIKQAWVHC